MQHEAICEFPSKEFYDGSLETAKSVEERKENAELDDFWPEGNAYPIMFVDIVGTEGHDNVGSNHGETKVGVNSKFNSQEAELVVSCTAIGIGCFYVLVFRFESQIHSSPNMTCPWKI
jgi:superfamily I DNA and/or RNA helicase